MFYTTSFTPPGRMNLFIAQPHQVCVASLGSQNPYKCLRPLVVGDTRATDTVMVTVKTDYLKCGLGLALPTHV